MKEVLSDIDRWRGRGRKVAVARVVGVEGSGPRDPGATMAVSEDGEVAGSVSGGCVEGAVVTAALEALGEGKPTLCTFGYSDDQAFAVGLTCGGTIHVLVDPELFDFYQDFEEALAAEEPVALATVIEVDRTGPGGNGAADASPTPARAAKETAASPAGGTDTRLAMSLLVRPGRTPQGSLGDPGLDRVVVRDALAALESGLSATRHYGFHGEANERGVGVFIEAFAPPPHMVIFGAVDFTAALAKVAKILGYRVTVCDARPVFATRARFPMADEVVVDWPQRYLEQVGAQLGPRDAVCVLTHDPKFDVPAITAALVTRVGYLGAMGSRRTHTDRSARLRDAGVDEEGLQRVMGPIGLDIGARSPEETAVSICAEIISLRTGRTEPSSLRDREGPIHLDREMAAAERG